jgi:PAS domain S-box-containing protein
MTSVARSSESPTTAEHLALALEAAEMGTWEWHITGGRVFWSAALERMHGIPEGSFPGTFEAYQRDIHPDDRARVLETIERTIRDHQPHRLEYRIVLPDGRTRWLQARGRLLLDEAQEPVRLIGVCMDVTAQRERDAAWDEAIAWRRHAEAELAEQTRLALLARDVGLALTSITDKSQMLQRCAQAVVDHLGAAFARVWTLNEAEQVLQLRASAGMYTHLDGGHSRVPVGQFKIGLIAEERKAHLTNAIAEDPRVGDPAWAAREGMVSFAGYPLIFGGRLNGVLAMFARHTLSPTDFDALSTVANAIAVGIARARADLAIRQSEERYRFLAEAAPTQVWTATAAGALEFANSQTFDYFGVDVSTLSAEEQQALVHEADRATVSAAWAEAFASGDPLEIEYRLRRHDGEFRWHLVRARAFRDPFGRVVRWFGTNTDIHELKSIRIMLAARAEELSRIAAELEYQRDLTMTITDNTASGLFMMNRDGYPIFMNAAACRMTGYGGLEEIQDRPLHDAVHFRKPDGSPYPMEECPIDRANAAIVPLRAQREVFCRKDGTLFPVEYNVAPLGRAGEIQGAVIEARDITAELAAQQALQKHAQDLAALAAALHRSNQELDQFAYIASHDLKAPLRGIANLSQWLEEDLGEAITDSAREHLTLLRSRVNRMEALIDGILQYSRAGRSSAPPEPVPLRRLLGEVIDLLQPPAHVAIDLPADLPVVRTERLPLQQVFLNLLGNAVKHAGSGADPRITLAWRAERDTPVFTVTDNGPGIAPAYHERIWGIFQTLQPRDKVEGTGIGLALVRKIVESRGGTVWVESAEGAGATFGFTWPATAREQA